MFNFFRRGKKEDNNNCRSKDKNGRDDRCKNTWNEPLPTVSQECDAIGEANDTIPTDSTEIKTTNEDTVKAGPQPTMLRKPEPQKNSNVKPCGHGTTAISPRAPLPATRRESLATPPSSPVLEIKKHHKERKSSISSCSSVEDRLPKLKILVADGSESSNATSPEDFPKDEKKNLINQEAKFQSQLNDLSKQLSIRDAEATKLRFQMEELQRDVFAKAAGMERLQAELNAAHKETELVRQRIRYLETDLENYRSTNSQLAEDMSDKEERFASYETETKAKILQLEETIKTLKERIESLENQLKKMIEEKAELEERHNKLLEEREEEKRKVDETIEQAMAQKQILEKKWKEDFEKLRTVNILKEQQLMEDFEWKLREVQQNCKKRLQDKDKSIEEKIQEAYKDAERKMKEAEDMMAEVKQLKLYETEVVELKNKTIDQEKALKEMKEQQEQMKMAEDSLRLETKKLRTLIELEKENLQHMQRKHHQEILDKERLLQQTLHQKRIEIAMYWEERLLHECGRLKNELEQIHSEEKYMAMKTVRQEKDLAFEKQKEIWDNKLRECLKEIETLKKELIQKDEYYKEEIIRTQTNTDRDILELRRLMDKIDMTHHEKYEKLTIEHEEEIERINSEHEKKVLELESYWQSQVASLRGQLELVKEQMEKESRLKIESLIQQHRSELDTQWEKLVEQKDVAIKLVEDEYATKFKALEEQCLTQQKSHSAREIELLKTVDSMKNELESKNSTIEDLQSNVDTLEGGVQVLNQEIAQQGEQLAKTRKEADFKIRGLQETMHKMQEDHEKEIEAFRLKLMSNQKQAQETIDHLQRKCQCLTKLFEEVRMRYERRESRVEDLNIISDLRQVIAEQEKDLACINEEKRYFQMRLMSLEKHLEGNASAEEDEFEDAQPLGTEAGSHQFTNQNTFCIPPTIPECDE